MTHGISVIGRVTRGQVRASLPVEHTSASTFGSTQETARSPDEVAREAGAKNGAEPGRVHTRLVRRHAEFLEDHGLVRALLRRRVVADPLAAPDAAAQVRTLAPAFWVQLRRPT